MAHDVIKVRPLYLISVNNICLLCNIGNRFNQDLPFHLCLFVFFQTARMRGVDCVVAPYEADAQLAFLNKSGIAQAVITEDSDLLAFGCKKVPVQCAI